MKQKNSSRDKLPKGEIKEIELVVLKSFLKENSRPKCEFYQIFKEEVIAGRKFKNEEHLTF